MPVVVALVFISPRCHKPPSRRFSGMWFWDLGSMISNDLTRQYWLTGKVAAGEWKNPLSASAMEEMEAPKIYSISIKPKGEVWRPFGVMSDDLEVTFHTEEKVFTVELDFNMPVRGKDWFPVYDTNWETGDTKYYEARDNYIYAIAAYGRFYYEKPTFEPVPAMQIAKVPADAYKDLAYKLKKGSIVIRDLREKKQYRFQYPKKGELHGTVQVSPIVDKPK